MPVNDQRTAKSSAAPAAPEREAEVAASPTSAGATSDAGLDAIERIREHAQRTPTLELGELDVLEPQRRVALFIDKIVAFHDRHPDEAACDEMCERIYGSYHGELSMVERPFAHAALKARMDAEAEASHGAFGSAEDQMHHPYSFRTLYYRGIEGGFPQAAFIGVRG